ncbi:hypothetical protein [Bradyrhizobium japonicum]|uniref:hypothetical protein n=1 Tax=Bradyrhizobium japonicum TaxID=375 RepID=UPI00138AD7E2|nr:hypothetical protein [Bradyrhizobium japonicum]
MTAEFFPEDVRCPELAIALDDSFRPLKGMALGGIVADADDNPIVERTDNRGTGGFERVAHNRGQIVGMNFAGHRGSPVDVAERNANQPRASEKEVGMLTNPNSSGPH